MVPAGEQDDLPLVPHRFNSSNPIWELVIGAWSGAVGGTIAGSATSAAIGAASGAGAAASRLLFESPLQKRQDALVAKILQRLHALERHQGRALEVDQLLSEEVVTVSEMAGAQSGRSDESKLEYLANAVVNVVAGEAASHDELATLMSIASDLTASHIKILEILRDPDDWERRTGNSVQPVQINGHYLSNLIIVQALGMDIGDPTAVRTISIVINDLESRGLTSTRGLGEPVASKTPSSLADKPISTTGTSLLRLVSLGPWAYHL